MRKQCNAPLTSRGAHSWMDVLRQRASIAIGNGNIFVTGGRDGVPGEIIDGDSRKASRRFYRAVAP